MVECTHFIQVHDLIEQYKYLWGNVSSKFAANPDVIEEDLTEEHEFMVLACDGIWDVLTNEEVVEFIRARIAQEMAPEVVSTHKGPNVVLYLYNAHTGWDSKNTAKTHNMHCTHNAVLSQRIIF